MEMDSDSGKGGHTAGNEFLMLAKSLIQFRDNNANNFNIPHDFNLNFQTIESPPPSPL